MDWIWVWCTFLLTALVFGGLAVLAMESDREANDSTAKAAIAIFVFAGVVCGLMGWAGILGHLTYHLVY